MDAAFALLEIPEPDEEDGAQESSDVIKLAVAGRPNVGKSTLINTWLGEERLVAFDMPGTTRDAISVPFERNGQKFELIDTAGLRRKGRVFEAIEKFSVVKTLQAIESSDVVLLLLDATQGVTDQDAHIAGYVLESGRAVVIAVNKWDAVDDYQRQLLERSIESRLSFLKFASLHFISAKKGKVLVLCGRLLPKRTRQPIARCRLRYSHDCCWKPFSSKVRNALGCFDQSCVMPTRVE